MLTVQKFVNDTVEVDAPKWLAQLESEGYKVRIIAVTALEGFSVLYTVALTAKQGAEQ